MNNTNKLTQKVTKLLDYAKEEDIHVLEYFLTAMEEKVKKDNSIFLRHLLNWETNYINDKTLEMTIPNHPLWKNSLNILHGGITATLLDTALGTIATYQYKECEGVVTTELKVNYLKPGSGNFLRCVATVVHKGYKLIVCEGKVYNDNNEIIAMATGGFHVVRKK